MLTTLMLYIFFRPYEEFLGIGGCPNEKPLISACCLYACIFCYDENVLPVYVLFIHDLDL